MMRTMLLLGCCLLAGCGGKADPAAPETDGTGADFEFAAPQSSDLRSASGDSVGTISMSEDGNGLTVTVEVDGLSAGSHAVHLHETGICEGPDFKSAGGHWNPTGAQHGRDNPMGSHLGDLANMEVSEDGQGRSTYLVREVSLRAGQRSIADADGTALVIHEGADDYRSDPAGDAGSRVACATLSRPADG